MPIVETWSKMIVSEKHQDITLLIKYSDTSYKLIESKSTFININDGIMDTKETKTLLDHYVNLDWTRHTIRENGISDVKVFDFIDGEWVQVDLSEVI